MRVLIGGDDDLAVRLKQRVEGVEELVLSALFAAEVLDVIHHQHVGVVAVLVAELFDAVIADLIYELVHKGLGLQIQDAPRRVLLLDLLTDGMQKVRLAQAHAAVNKQRIVFAGRVFSDGATGSSSKLIRGANHKRIERVLGQKVRHFTSSWRDSFGLGAYCGSRSRGCFRFALR